MATRGTIVVKIKDEDLGKKVKVNPKFLTDNEAVVEKYNKKCFEITLSKRYAEIYQHWDSYPEGLGESLVRGWTDYEKALNLILGGDASSVDEDGVTQYVVMEDRDEQYERLQPTFTDDVPNVSEEYQYLLDDGVWYVRDDYDMKEFKPVTEVLEKSEED